MRPGLIALAAACALAGCATQPAPQTSAPATEARVIEAPEAPTVVEPLYPRPAPAPAPAVDDGTRMLSYFDRLRRMPAPELARELDAMRAAYSRNHDETDRLKLAMIYALPGSAVTDDSRALDLLEPLVKAIGHPLHDVAVVLFAYVQEQKRLALNAQALQKEVQALQQKLDALRSLERALSEREAAPPRRR
jgi:hypothetical protein